MTITSQAELDDLKSRARRVLEDVFPADDEGQLAGLISSEFVNHEAPAGTPAGLGSITYFMHMLARAFSEQKWTIDHVVAEGDTVAVHCTHSGHHTGPYFGLPATGRRFAYKQMHMIRIVDGKAVEHWAVRDDASLMRQLATAASAAPSSSGTKESRTL